MKKFVLAISIFIIWFGNLTAQNKMAQAASGIKNAVIEVGSKGSGKAETITDDAQNAIFIRQSINKIFEQQLKNDGVLTKKDKKFNLQLTENTLIVNGKLLSEALTEKYKGIYLGLMRKEECVGCTISFEIDKDYSFNEKGY
jgi:hypothetical protein